MVLDGTLIPIDRVAADRPFYSGKHRRRVLPKLEAAGLVTLADKGYQGAAYAKLPYRGRNKPESQKQANRAHANSAHPANARTPSSRPNAT